MFEKLLGLLLGNVTVDDGNIWAEVAGELSGQGINDEQAATIGSFGSYLVAFHIEIYGGKRRLVITVPELGIAIEVEEVEVRQWKGVAKVTGWFGRPKYSADRVELFVEMMPLVAEWNRRQAQREFVDAKIADGTWAR